MSSIREENSPDPSFLSFLAFFSGFSRENSLAVGATPEEPISSSQMEEDKNDKIVIRDDDCELELAALPSELKKLVECPVCYEIILPPITLCSGGHAVCLNCKRNLNSCPICRGRFTNVRCRLVEQILDKCSIKCKYRESGCVAKLPGNDLAAHHPICNFRPLLCRECDMEIPYHMFLDHLKNAENLEAQRATECSTGFEIEDEELSRSEGVKRFSVWEPTWIKAYGKNFFCFLETMDSHWWIWIGGYATPEECEKFICSITVWNKETTTELKYVGKIHPIRTSPEDVLESGSCLSFLDANLRNLMYKGGIDVLVRLDTEYVAPKTRKGTIVESPLAVFGSDSPAKKESNSRANRVNRSNGIRSSQVDNTDTSVNLPDDNMHDDDEVPPNSEM